jgi:hypothetical protein
MLEAITNILPFLRLLNITPYNATYDLPFVALSVGVAVLAMYVALSVADRIVASSRRPVRLLWTAAGAIVMGGGIWSMHFIGMLAFSLPCGVGYNPLLTLVSILPGVLASGVALFVLSRREQPPQKLLFVCALLMGAESGRCIIPAWRRCSPPRCCAMTYASWRCRWWWRWRWPTSLWSSARG